MFTLLKVIKPLLLPPFLVLAGMAAALLLAIRKKCRWTICLLAVTLLGYYLFSIEPVASFLVRSLERSVPVVTGEGEPEAILVLAGGYWEEGGSRPLPELAGSTWRRFWRGIEIYRDRGGKIPILYAGGSGDPFQTSSDESRLARSYAVAMGIPEEDFWIEEESRDTFENAREARAILDRKFPGCDRHRVILVTSSTHMLRSYLVLKKAGLDPIPYPADYPAGRIVLSPLTFYPGPRHLLTSTRCIHEWLGIAAYRLMGRL